MSDSGTGRPVRGQRARVFQVSDVCGQSLRMSLLAGRPTAVTLGIDPSEPDVTAFVAALLGARPAIDALDAQVFALVTDQPPDDGVWSAAADHGVLHGPITDRLALRVGLDPTRNVANAYGLTGRTERCTVILDQSSRVHATVPWGSGGEGHAAAVLDALAEVPPFGAPSPAAVQAPVLFVPNVLEPELCRTLMAHYDTVGGEASGFMTERHGRTVMVMNEQEKRRSDVLVEDAQLQRRCMARIAERLIPELKRAFQFEATRIERYLIGCYDASESGFFRPHRDNSTKGTAHRRFAVTINLNAEDYEGGDLRFPEYSSHLYRAETGGAVVFSCSLLHEATAVTSGRRFAFLPFLYDELGRAIRDRNAAFVNP